LSNHPPGTGGILLTWHGPPGGRPFLKILKKNVKKSQNPLKFISKGDILKNEPPEKRPRKGAGTGALRSGLFFVFLLQVLHVPKAMSSVKSLRLF
jgi:hypothetical protein